MNFINKLGLALTAIFVISLVFLAFQILYLLWRKRRPHSPDIRHVELGSGGGGGDFHHDHHSKEVLYFLCWKNHHQANRVKPAVVATETAAVGTTATVNTAAMVDEEFEEMVKLHEMYGPSSRTLFTIKEETETESELGSFRQNVVVTATEVVDDDDEDEVTAFKTPCGSPPYYTPSPSPPREKNGASFRRNLTDKIAGR
ncbi:hypothetical protein LINGRAHAP2_LOCUS13013 [Linum grandiflorum]